jgi:hypothetical protein
MVSVAQYMKSSGLVDAGYNLLIHDIGWAATNRDAQGLLQPSKLVGCWDGASIPDVVAALATNGVRLGLYISGCDYDGPDGCQAGSSLSTAYLDGYTLGKWGIKWAKFDRIGGVDGSDGSVWHDDAYHRFFELFAAGADQGCKDRGSSDPMILDVQGDDRLSKFPKWFCDVGNVSYYGNGDFLRNGWTNFIAWVWHNMWPDQWVTRPGFFRYNLGIFPRAGSFVIGSPVTTDMVRAQLGFTAILSGVGNWYPAPSEPVEILYATNKTLLGIWRDPMCAQAQLIASNATGVILSKAMTNGDTALLFWNWTSAPNVMSCALTNLPGTVFGSTAAVIDAWDGCVAEASGSLSATVNPYGANLYRLSKGGHEAGRTPGVLTVLTNLALWYKADGHAYAHNSAADWPDSSGHGYNATSASGRPIYVTNALNGLPAYYFNGASSLATTYKSPDSANCSAFVVYNCTNAVDMDQIIFSKDYLRGVMLCARKGQDFRAYNLGAEASGQADSEWNVAGYVSSGGFSRVYGPNCCVTTSAGPAVRHFNGSLAVTLGNDCAGCDTPNNWFGGYIAEILYYNAALSPEARANVMAYLRAKYKLQ